MHMAIYEYVCESGDLDLYMTLPKFGKTLRHDKPTHYHELTADHRATKGRISTRDYNAEEAHGQKYEGVEMTKLIKVTLKEEEAPRPEHPAHVVVRVQRSGVKAVRRQPVPGKGPLQDQHRRMPRRCDEIKAYLWKQFLAGHHLASPR